MADLTPARIAEFRAFLAMREANRLPRHAAIELLNEIDRLRAVIRETHAPCIRVQNNYRTEHMVHLPGCKLYEIEP